MKRRPSLLSLLALLLGFTACASSPGLDHEISEMTLDEKVGQLVVVAAQGTFMNESSPAYRRLLRYVRDHHVGGVIWYGADVYETAWVNDRLQEAAAIPLLISADLEAGVGMRFDNTTFWPWAMAVAATGDTEYAERQGRIVAREAKLLGINQIYAPVADVNNNPDNPVINVRSYGEDPVEVARFVSAFIRGVQSEKILATVKHFPGHGDTHTDSHRSLPTLDVDRGRLDAVELVPFRAAIRANVASVMLAHLALPSLDPAPFEITTTSRAPNPYTDEKEIESGGTMTVPASLSTRLVDGLLRRELGFDGLVVTDALDMGGITRHLDAGEAAVRAIEAGADQVLKTADYERSIEALKAAVSSGRISMERLDRSVRRILLAKRQIPTTRFEANEIFRGVDRPDHHSVALETAQRAITLVRAESGALPLARAARVVELVIGDFPDNSTLLATFHQELGRRLDTAPERFLLDRNSTPADLETIIPAIESADTVVVAFTVRTRSGAGSVAIPETARTLIEQVTAMSDLEVIGISFGNPYLLREAPFLRTYLAAYGVQPVMQTAAAQAIFGETPISGRLPVTIPGIATRGAGIRVAAQR